MADPSTSGAAAPAVRSLDPRALFVALGFLTVLPVPAGWSGPAGAFGRATGYFPAVGALLGLALAALDLGLRVVLSPGIAAVLDLGALALLTGGLHLDALADTCDGLFGGRSSEQRLEIMRDSRVGSFGVIGIVLVLLLEATALGGIGGGRRIAALVLAPTLGRWAMALAVALFPYARPAGLGAAFKATTSRLDLALAAVSALLIGFGGAQLEGVALFGAATGVAMLLAVFACSRLGGLTGDTYGAIGQVVEAAVFVALAGVLA
jgi:adenosylcobinamide-GDP ribazoletransferase